MISDELISMHWQQDLLSSVEVGIVVMDKDFTIEVWIYPTFASRQAIFAFESDHQLGMDFHYPGDRNVNIWVGTGSWSGGSWNILNMLKYTS